MHHRKHDVPFLSTPKGVFLIGFILGAMSVMTIGFLILVGNAMKGGTLLSGLSAGNDRPSAPAPTPVPSDELEIGDPRPVGKDDHVRGTGPTTIIEYSDLECPFCKRFHETMKQVLAANPGKVRWVYRHFPLTQLHSQAQKEAEATECAGEQGKFWEMTDKIFEVTPSNDGLPLPLLPDLARQAGVRDIAKFQKCLDSGASAARVRADAEDAVTAGGRGTPYSVVLTADGRKDAIPGAVDAEQVQQLLDALDSLQ